MKDHVGSLKKLLDFLSALLSSLFAYLGNPSGSQSSCELLSKRHSDLSIRTLQCLNIGIHRHERDFFKAAGNHSVYGVTSGASDPDDFYIGRWRLLVLQQIF